MTERCLTLAAGLALLMAGCDGATPEPAGAESRAWSTAVLVEDDHAEVDDYPAVALDDSGDGVIAWQRGSAILARWYDGAARTFGAVSQLTPASRSAELEVGIDAQGNALLVFARDDSPSSRGIWWSQSANRGTSWSAPKPIAIGAAYRPRLAVSAGGIALAVWSDRSEDSLVTVHSSAFRDGAWRTVNTPLLGTDSGERNPRVAVDQSGRGFIIWEEPAAPNQESSIWSERYEGDWLPESVSTRESYTEDDAYTPELALNEAGAGMALWLELHPPGPQLWARRFDGMRWGDPQLIAAAPLIEWDPPPQVAIDPTGSSLAVWSQVTSLSEVPPYYDVHAARSQAGATTWQTPEALETTNRIGSDLTQYAEPLVGLDRAGNAITTWRKVAASSLVRVFSSRLSAPTASWLPNDGAALHEDDEHSAQASALAVSRNGSALAAWSYGPEHDIWVSAYAGR